MPSSEFTPELCERLYAAPKRIVSRIEWKPSPSGTVLLQAAVFTEDGTGLELSGYWAKVERYSLPRWGFALRYLGYCIRSYDMAGSHKNPREHGRIKGPHKHRFSSSKIARYAYKPYPPISADDPNQSLMDFLRESNISIPKGYQQFMFT